MNSFQIALIDAILIIHDQLKDTNYPIVCTREWLEELSPDGLVNVHRIAVGVLESYWNSQP